MKRFRFPLRPVAVLRGHQEVRAREAFGAAVQRYTAAQDEVKRLALRMRTLEAELSQARATSFRPSETVQLLADYGRECAAEAEADRRVATARVEMHKARLEYIEAHRQLEIVKRLEEKARNTHRLETNRAEQSEMDELAGQQRTQPFSLSS